MFLLDTNVLSELRRPRLAAPKLLEWAGSTARSRQFISAVTMMELEMGVLSIERRDPAQGGMLRNWLVGKVEPSFDGRILPFGSRTAQICARLHVPDRRPERDAMIAATALEHGLTMVTRNVADFSPLGVPVFNPWQA